MRLVADISRIVREVGWQPRIKLEDGLAQTIPFYELTRAIWVSQPV